MAEVQGTNTPEYDDVRSVLQRSLDSGADLGASVAVVHDGRLVVDLWGGSCDVEGTRPWERDTVTNIFSTNKTMLALCALVLVDRAELDVFAPVARYWPEFAANGKADIEVRHVLSHTSGLSGWSEPVTMADLHDWEKATGLLAAQAPWWKPGTAAGYHLISYNHLVGELVRRVSGRMPAEFFVTEVAGPLGADIRFGLSDDNAARWSPMLRAPAWKFAARALPKLLRTSPRSLRPGSVMLRTFTNPRLAEAASPDLLRSPAPMNGIANARSVAQVQSAMSHGGEVNGVRLLSERTIDLVFRQQSDGVDLVLGEPTRFGIGYALPTRTWPVVPDSRVCWWTGTGGSKVINLVDQRLTFAYVMNRMGAGIIDDPRSDALFAAVLAGLRRSR